MAQAQCPPIVSRGVLFGGGFGGPVIVNRGLFGSQLVVGNSLLVDQPQVIVNAGFRGGLFRNQVVVGRRGAVVGVRRGVVIVNRGFFGRTRVRIR